MNSKAAREGFVQSSKDLEAARERVLAGITAGLIKNAGDEKAEKKEQKVEEKAEKKELKQELKDQKKIEKKEAEAMGFFRFARACGWGIYSVDSLDGGQGSIWYLEKDATTGVEYLVKQLDHAGDVVRRISKNIGK